MINKEYTKKTVIEKIKKTFDKEGSVQLQNFIELEIPAVNFVKSYIPYKYCFRSAEFSDKNVIDAIKEFLEKLVGKELTLQSSTIFNFKIKDYTLMRDDVTEDKGIKAIFEFTNNWKEEFGGYTSFVKNNKEVFRVNPVNNSLTIIKTDKKTRSFVKYMNHKAENNRRVFVEIVFN